MEWIEVVFILGVQFLVGLFTLGGLWLGSKLK